MRVLLCLVVLAGTSCTKAADPGDALVGVYRRSDRDGLCIAREGEALKAGLITYGNGATNCSLAGRAEIRGDILVVSPRGELDCSVEIRVANGAATLGGRTQSCAYYCGPGADYAGRVLRKAPDAANKVTDFAGDPLC